ncbi:short-chain dehydrogenase/reductase SDR, partial [Hyaloraphidium curvatum]
MNTEGTAADGRGRTAVITGGSAGVGLATAKELAGAGWRVIIGCRDVVKGSCAVATLPGTEALKLDLCDDASVDAFAAVVTARSPAIDLLILNAAHVGDATGGSGPQLDAAGREKTFSANHLGHARLTHALLPVLLAGRARVVAVSALGHKWAKLRRDDVQMLRP